MGAFREYADHDATGLAALLRAGEISREEVIEAALEDDASLPISMQSAAAYGDDGLLLGLAAQLEAETGCVDWRPPLAGAES